MHFQLFKYQRNFILFFIGVPLGFVLFLVSFLIGWILFSQEFPVGWIYLSVLILLPFGWMETIIVSHFRFRPIGTMLIEDNKIILNLDKGIKIFEFNELKNVKIFYAGDIFWKSFTNFFTKLKGNNRYYSKHWSTKQNELEGIDKIFLNEEEYHVFIKRQEDKNQLLDFMSLLRKNNINVSWQEGNFKPPQILKF